MAGRSFRKVFLGLAAGIAFPHALTVTVDDFSARSYTSKGGIQMAYRLFVPKNYDNTKAYPIMLTLHGAGERGTDNRNQLKYDFGLMWADSTNQAGHPCFVLAPQCPNNSTYGWVNTAWNGGSYNFGTVAISPDLQAAVEILDSISSQYRIDTLRQYVSGMSMGGYATWYLLMRFPQRFAAAVPVCGAGDPTRAASIKNVPIWAFHAADDGVVPVSGSRDMINALNTAAANPVPKYTEYPISQAVGHGSWVPASQNTALVPWVFGQARTPTPVLKAPARKPEPVPGPNDPGLDGLGRRNGEFPPLQTP